MTEGTEDAETQEPSIYKDFGQKVRLVRLEGRAQSASVLEALIRPNKSRKTPEIRHFRGLFMKVSLTLWSKTNKEIPVK